MSIRPISVIQAGDVTTSNPIRMKGFWQNERRFECGQGPAEHINKKNNPLDRVQIDEESVWHVPKAQARDDVLAAKPAAVSHRQCGD